MKLLYVATDQVVPGRTGGSIHVLEVARGLAARGHELHVVLQRQQGQPARETRDGITWHRLSWRPQHRVFRLRARPQVRALCAELRPEAVMERYYNFGGEGLLSAEEHGVPSLLEVNSPLLDHRRSLKGALDALLLVRPLRRHRERLCRSATALVSPLPEIVPAFARPRTVTVTWGANVSAFAPERRSAELRRAWGVPEGALVVAFSGSFRPWHGVHVLEGAARRLRARSDLFFLLVGGALRGEAQGFRGRRLGALPYEEMPAVMASADVGVAPYDTRRLRQLELGFFWSPLKIFEYMASGLPTLTVPRPPLTEIVREGQEGAFFREADEEDLAGAIERLAADPARRAAMGALARARVVERYSWASHCAELEALLLRLRGSRTPLEARAS